MGKWIELLKPGVWKDRTGKVVEITKETIRRIHDNYCAEKPAHILVGHPDKAVVPSFGVIDQLKMAGDVLLCRPGQVVAEFASLVGKGAFPGVSAGLTADLSRLDHVAFLSAQRPAIDGLKPVLEFSAMPEIGVVSVDVTESFDRTEFASAADWTLWRIKSIGFILRSIKNYLIEKEGQERADALVDEYRMTDLQADPPEEMATAPQFSTPEGGSMEFEKLYNELKAAVDGLLAKFAIPGVTEFSAHVDGVVLENDRLKTENAALHASVAQFHADKRGLEFSAYVEGLVTARKVKPDEKLAIVDRLEQMHQVTPVEFSAEGGKKSPLDIYKAELEARTVCVPPTGEEPRGPEFSAGDATDGVAIGRQMQAYMAEQQAKGVVVNVHEARLHVMGK